MIPKVTKLHQQDICFSRKSSYVISKRIKKFWMYASKLTRIIASRNCINRLNSYTRTYCRLLRKTDVLLFVLL